MLVLSMEGLSVVCTTRLQKEKQCDELKNITNYTVNLYIKELPTVIRITHKSFKYCDELENPS